MADLPERISISEEGPREGFQYEPGPIATARKIELIDALSLTGLMEIQVASFVRSDAVPGMADAEAVVAGMTRVPSVSYTGLWFNERGLNRALATGRLDIEGTINLIASDAFLLRNLNREPETQMATQRSMLSIYRDKGIPVRRAQIGAAFGCNFAGDIALSRVLDLAQSCFDLAAEFDFDIEEFGLLDTMAWATPQAITRTVGAVRDAYPDLQISLHLHDTRGMAIANACAGLSMGVAHFDAAVGGLGGCPFAGHTGAAGNISTEDLVFLCHEMGIETGVDLDRLIDVALLAEKIVGHPLPGSVKTGGTLERFRRYAKP